MSFFRVVLCDVCFVTFPILFVCICVLNNCHWMSTQLQLNISYHKRSQKTRTQLWGRKSKGHKLIAPVAASGLSTCLTRGWPFTDVKWPPYATVLLHYSSGSGVCVHVASTRLRNSYWTCVDIQQLPTVWSRTLPFSFVVRKCFLIRAAPLEGTAYNICSLYFTVHDLYKDLLHYHSILEPTTRRSVRDFPL
jgi:hypothetical protein